LKIPFLLSSPTLGAAQQARMLSMLYAQPRSLVEGSFALTALLGVCLVRTGSRAFVALAAATLVVLALRLLHCGWFHRCQAAGSPPAGRSAEAWARDFTIGATGTALAWGVTDLVAILGFPDHPLHLFVLMVQGGWMGSLAIRNAVAPMVVYCQTFIPGLLAFAALVLAPRGFVQLATPFIVLHMVANVGIARFGGDRIVSMLESEERLARANARLLMLSATDGLTGIANRRTFDTQLASVWAQAIRANAVVALLIADVDYFKRYNDRHGHLRGDDCLRRVARCVADVLGRETDLAARYGGEEFAVLLPGTTTEGAAMVAERLRCAVLAIGMEHAASPFGQVTISVGIASATPGKGDHPDMLITLADQALYNAKRAGRNQVSGLTVRQDQGDPRTVPADPAQTS
jgi:diguanylate cyclase (GGDEF)-like protein